MRKSFSVFVEYENYKVLCRQKASFLPRVSTKTLHTSQKQNSSLHREVPLFQNVRLSHHNHSKSFFSKQAAPEKAQKDNQEELEVWGGSEAFKQVIFITNNFNEVLSKNSQVLVFFYAMWCPHCKKLKRSFGKAALSAKEANLPLKFACFDIDFNLEIADSKGVVGIPVLKYYKDGKFISNFKGKRTADELLNFAKNPPVSSSEPAQVDV